MPAFLLERYRQLAAEEKRQVAIRAQERRRAQHVDNTQRLAQARLDAGPGRFRLRWECRVFFRKRYYCLRGRTVILAIPEVIDAWEVVADVERFLKGWRPSRLRSEAHRAEVDRWWQTWERLASARGENGRWSA